MEPIKFKAWDKKHKKMYHGGDIRVALAFPNEDVAFLQFIGTHDKHGKDIYASDIVKSEKYQKQGVVTFNTRDCSWYVGDLMIRFFMADGPHDLEIIGNAHENPELSQ